MLKVKSDYLFCGLVSKMKIIFLTIFVISVFSVPQAFADWDLDNVDFEILKVNFDTQITLT